MVKTNSDPGQKRVFRQSRSTEMKTVAMLVLCLAAGCTAVNRSSTIERDLVGEFQEVVLTSASYLDLNTDHTYSEDISNSRTFVVLNGHATMARVPNERGRWHVDGNRVILVPADGGTRVLNVEWKRDSIILRESTAHGFREYLRA